MQTTIAQTALVGIIDDVLAVGVNRSTAEPAADSHALAAAAGVERPAAAIAKRSASYSAT